MFGQTCSIVLYKSFQALARNLVAFLFVLSKMSVFVNETRPLNWESVKAEISQDCMKYNFLLTVDGQLLKSFFVWDPTSCKALKVSDVYMDQNWKLHSKVKTKINVYNKHCLDLLGGDLCLNWLCV